MSYLNITNLQQKLIYDENSGNTILTILKKNNIDLENPCNGKGTCGKCKVKIIEGKLNEIREEERKHLTLNELQNGVRLSCYTIPKGEVTVRLLDKHTEKINILEEGYMPNIEFKPALFKESFKLPNNLGEDNRALEDIIEDIIGSKLEERLRILLLKKLPYMFCKKEFTAICSKNKVIGLEVGDTRSEFYGVAVDIGTTTVVVALINLTNGKEIGIESQVNPQKKFGLDVLSRIEYVKSKKDGLKELHEIIVNCLNNLINTLCIKANISNKNIYEITIAANGTMMHLLLEVNTGTIGVSPYNTVFNKSVTIDATSIGIKVASCAMVYCLPGVSSYIGSDIVAGVVVSELYNSRRNILFIDIGTNGEIVLSKKGKLCSCSCAAGPALEGMNITCGMRASQGAIEGIEITKEHIKLKVIGHCIPNGICGSGILEAISEIFRVGLLGKTGRLIKYDNLCKNESINYLKNYLIEDEGFRRVLLYSEEKEIFITQNDIRQVQLAKGAILSGFYSLLELMEITMEDLDEVIIAGQFGKHLSVKSLLGVGLLPKELESKINYIGNTSKTGAVMCLISEGCRNIMEETARGIEYFELSTKEGYDRLFVKCMNFG